MPLAAPVYTHLPPQVFPMRLGGAAGGSAVSPVGPAKQAANQLFPGPQGVCLPESRPVQIPAANNHIQEEGNFKEMSTLKTKTNKHRNHDRAQRARGRRRRRMNLHLGIRRSLPREVVGGN